ncbi:MAG: hypothetical protein N3A54_06450 [Patescibacteria group bacterium]|nr:hypothetical protein [Patescibacteria group bacterium]
MTYTTPDDLREEVELKIVELIKEKLENGTMTEERSEAIAQHVLDTLKPGMSFQELYKAIFNLDDQFIELSPIVLPIIRDYDEKVIKKVTKKVSELIQQGQYEEAEELSKKAIAGNLKIVWQASAKA